MNKRRLTTLSGRRLLLALLGASSLIAPGRAIAGGVTAANSATTVQTAPSGITVVDIAKANSAGLSNNLYTNYNVDSSGLVLNNGNSSQLMRQSQLAGAVAANLNLVNPATVILNQVVSTNRSTLAGYTEVLGPAADVIVANPNGITCSGCGFINTPNVTLTTGNPIVGASGALNGFSVDNGDILINGNGLDASKQDYLGLIARSVAIQGQINAQALDVIAGANNVDYATKAVTAHATTGTAPTLAIDSSALGGMYANRIRLVATEAGVGVRTLGNAAAGTGDFSLDSAGKIEIGGAISAQQNVAISTTASGANAIQATNAHISAQQNLSLTANGGNIHLYGGTLTAALDLALASDSLTDESTTDSATDNNKRYAAGTLTLTQANGISIDGTTYGTAGAFNLTGDSLSIGAGGATLYGNTLNFVTAHDLALGTAALQSQGNLSLTSTAGGISTAAASGEGVESVAGNVTFLADTGIDNAGAVSADLGSLTVNADGTIANSGALYAKTTGFFNDLTNAGTEDITNSGTIVDDSLTVTGDALTNQSGGGIQGTNGSTFTLSSLDNSGTIIGSANSADSATINANTLTNETTGIIQSAKDLTLNIKTGLTNSYEILATGDLSAVASDSGTTLTVTNDSTGVMQAGGTLSINGTGGGGNVTLNTQSGDLLGNGLSFNLSSLTNSGTIQSAEGLSLSVTNGITNDNMILADGNLNVVAGTLTNNSGAAIQGGGGSTFTLSALDNYGTVIGSTNGTDSATIDADTLTNESTGIIQSAQDLILNIKNALTNNNDILAAGNLTATARTSGTTLAINNISTGVMQAGGTFGIAGTTGGDNVSIGTQSGDLLGNTLSFYVASLTNSGTIQGGSSSSSIAVGNTLRNNSGAYLNLATSGSGSGTLTAADLVNSGTILSSGNLTATATDALTNNGTGIIESGNDLTLNARNALTNDYEILAAGNLNIFATTDGTTLALVNNSAGILQAGTNGTLTIAGSNSGDNVTLGTQSGDLIGRGLSLNLSSLTNSGTIQGGFGDSIITVQNTLTNNVGGLINVSGAGGSIGDLSASTVMNNGIIQSNGDMTIAASNSLTNGSTGIIQSNSDVTLNAGTNLNNDFEIFAYGNINIDAANSGTLAVANASTGLMQAGETLGIMGNTYGGNNVTLNTQAGKMIGNELDFYVTSLVNSGTIQGGYMDTTSINADTLTNNSGAVINLATASGAGTITAGNLTNNGTLQSDGGMTLDLGTSTLTDGAGDEIIAGQDLNITAGGISFGSSSSAIIAGQSGSGTGTITLGSNFVNNALLFSGGNLNLSAFSILNTSTGGIAALGTLQLTSTGVADTNLSCGGPVSLASILNCGGSLYAGSALNVYAKPYYYITGNNNSLAYGGTFVNESGGTMNSSGDMNVNAGNFYNYDNINATGSITINVGSHNYPNANGDFENDISGSTPANIIAGNTLTIENFFTGANSGSNLAATTITLDTNGLSFTNQSSGGHAGNIFATNLNAENFALVNAGSPTGPSVTTQSDTNSLGGDASTVSNTLANGKSAISGTSSSGASSVSSASSVSGAFAVSGASSFTLGGIHIQLPTNPNGFFIVNPNPKTGPLIETNPLYAVGSAFLGSAYMEQAYGVDPDKIERDLGDANYEASLILQQVSTAGAISILGVGTANQAAAMQQLMTNGDTIGKSIGLTMGVAPTASQLANLSSDMVWMVDTVVDGQHVLAPVVYLSAATKSQIAGGAVIEATNANMNLSSLDNNGGTISAANMNVTTFGNLTNTSGTITGVNLSLASTNGDIINQTLAQTTGGVGNMQTIIGNTGVISATGNLSLDAANNISNLGANMLAGGSASLTAGKNIDFDSVLNQQSTSSGNSTTTSITNIKSGLTVGGNLDTSSGNDTTFAATNATIGGNANLNTGGNLNIIARNDSAATTTASKSGNIITGEKSTVSTDAETTNVASDFNVGGDLNSKSGGNTTILGSNLNVTGNGAMAAGGDLNILAGANGSDTSSATTKIGLGVGGGLYGMQTTNDSDLKSTSVASNLNFGGNANLGALGALTVQGSNVGAGGNLGVNAQSVNILAAQNTDVSTHIVDTTTLFSKGDNSASGNAGANTDYTPTQQQTGMGQTQTQGLGANASAGENATGAGLTLVNYTTTGTVDASSTAVGSSLKSGGDLAINSAGNTLLQGATVSAGGAADLNAGGDLNIEAAQNTHTVSTSTDSTSVGLYTSSQNGASSGANAGYANGTNGTSPNDLAGTATSDSTATATAGGQAASNNNLNLVDNDQSGSTTTDITHTGTTITSGGDTGLGAKNDINIAGSSIDARGNLSANAGQNLNVTAVQDSHTVTANDSDTTAGLYADGSANASATGTGELGSKYGGVDTQASGTASANANGGIGLQGSNTTSSSSSGSTTAVTSSLSSGGNMTRTAGGTITDQGTQINVGGDLTQNAAAWNSEAAQDATFSNTGNATNTAQLGLYAGANASKSGNYDQNATTVGQDPSASAGVSASYQQNTSGASSTTSTAVVSNIHTGGGFSSTTTGATALQGTNITSGGDVNLNAASLDDTAAQNTSSSSNSSGNINASLQVGKGTSGYSAALNGGADSLGTSSSSTTAVVGGITSGGNLNVDTTGDQTYEGTNLSAAKSANVQSTGGNVTFDAAQNSASDSENYQGFTASISGNEKGGGASFDGGTNGQSSNSTTAVTSTVKAGDGLTVMANNGLTLQGTNLDAGGDVTLGANTLDYQAAQNTAGNSQASQTLNIAASGKSDGSAAALAGSYVNNDTSGSSTTAVVGGINAGGNLNINTTGDQAYTGTNINAGKDANIGSTSGGVNFNQAQDSATNSSTQWGVSGSASTAQGSDGGTTQQAALGGGYQTNSGATTTGVAGNIKTGGALDVTSDKDLTLQGTNITTGGDTSLDSTGGNVNYQAATSTATGSGWGVNAQVSGSDSSSGSKPSQSMGGQVGGNYSSQNDTTQTAGSINSGGGVTVKGNQDVTLVGTNVTSARNTTVAATNGNVNIEAATSTKNDQSYAAALGVKNTSEGSGATATSKNAYSGGVDVDVNEASTETGATFKTGSLDVTSGKDANLTGTNIQTTGDTSLNAGGNLNLTAAESTNGGVNLNASVAQSKGIPGLVGAGGVPIIENAGVNGGANYQGVTIASGGNLNTSSGGATTMQATQATVAGTAKMDAAGGVKDTSTTSGGIDLGFALSKDPTGAASLGLPSTGTTQINAKGGAATSKASAAPPSLSPQQTQTISKSLTSAVSATPPALQSSLTSILNNANLSTADKFTKMTAAINNDPTLSQADKTKMLSALTAQQQGLSTSGK